MMTSMFPHPTPSVLEDLEAAHALIARALGRAPQLHGCHLGQALLVLAWSMQRARRSPKLRPDPRARDPQLSLW
jgi:hypothetical protein